jgi:hypothetical protein
MGPETIVTLIGVFLAVGAVALYLIIIAYTLNRVSFTVGTVLIGVRSIAAQTEPVGNVVGDIYRGVQSIEHALSNLLGEGPAPRALRAPGRARALGS